MAWSEWKKFSEPSLLETEFQFGSKNTGEYIHKYINNNCSKLSITSQDANARITVAVSNDDSNYTVLITKQNTATDLDISGYKYVELTTGKSNTNYGQIYTYNLSYS